MRETLGPKVLDVARSEPICVRVTLAWLVAIGFLVAMHWASILTHLRLGEDHFVPRQLLKLFYMDTEGNFPAWFSYLHAVDVFAPADRHRLRGAGSRAGLGGVVADPGWGVGGPFDGRVGGPARVGNYADARAQRGAGGFLYFGWILPGAIATSIVGLIYVPLLVRLPAATRVFFVVGGAVYVLGAISLESIGGYLTSSEGASVLPWVYRGHDVARGELRAAGAHGSSSTGSRPT